MECRIRGADVHYVEHGAGVPLFALHGAGVDHREIEAAIEAVVPPTGYRRIYPDLPGVGRSTTAGLTRNDDVVDLLVDLVEGLTRGPAPPPRDFFRPHPAPGAAAPPAAA